VRFCIVALVFGKRFGLVHYRDAMYKCLEVLSKTGRTFLIIHPTGIFYFGVTYQHRS